MKLIKKLFPFSFKEKKNVGTLVVHILLYFVALVCFCFFYPWFMDKFVDIMGAIMNFFKMPQWFQGAVAVVFIIIQMVINWLSGPYMLIGSAVAVMDYLKVFKEQRES